MSQLKEKSKKSKGSIQLEFEFDKQIESLKSTAKPLNIKEMNRILALMACQEYQSWFNLGAESLKDNELIIFRMKEISRKIWNWDIPPENEFAQYFKISRMKARRLLRSIKSRFGYECNEKLDRLTNKVIDNAIPDNKERPTKYTLYIINPLVEYRISEILSELAKREIEENQNEFRIMKKDKNFEFTYIILPDAYGKLNKYLKDQTK